MSVKTKEKVEFDTFKTLVVIQSDKAISEMFTSKFGSDYKKHFLLLSKESLQKDAIDLIERIFNTIIANDKKLIGLYNSVKKPEVKSVKYSKVKRRLSLSDINKQIAERGGEATENERALIACNELKNIYVRIHNKGKKALFNDDDARNMIATIETVKKKLLPILDK